MDYYYWNNNWEHILSPKVVIIMIKCYVCAQYKMFNEVTAIVKLTYNLQEDRRFQPFLLPSHTSLKLLLQPTI